MKASAKEEGNKTGQIKVNIEKKQFKEFTTHLTLRWWVLAILIRARLYDEALK